MAQSSQEGSHRRHRDRDHDGVSIRYTNTDWEAKEALYQRELDEARARATQMEKTMRWWSDCTANWRDKWSKVRTERNKTKEEAKQLKYKADTLNMELIAMRSEKHDIEQELLELKRENEKLLSLSENKIVTADLNSDDVVELRRKNVDQRLTRQRASLDSHKLSHVDNVLANKLSEIRQHLDAKCKSLQGEKDQKIVLLSRLEKLTADLQRTKIQVHSDSIQLGSTDSSHSEIERLQNELQDEVAAKQVLEEKLAEYKMEIEKLKSENTIQWSKRELLETENVAILRENKKLYSQVCELREQIHKLNRISDHTSYANDHAKLESTNVLYVRNTSTSPRSRDASSNGSSEMNLAQSDRKSNTSGENEDLPDSEKQNLL